MRGAVAAFGSAVHAGHAPKIGERRGAVFIADGVIKRRIEVADEVGKSIAVRVRRRIGRRARGGAPTDFQAVRQAVAVGVGAQRIRLAVCLGDVNLAVRPAVGSRRRQVGHGRFREVAQAVIVVVGIRIVAHDDLADDHGRIAGGGRFDFRIGIGLDIRAEGETSGGHIRP